MKWAPRVFIMTAVSVAVAILLSYVSKLDDSALVFRQARPVTEATIVDVVSGMKLHLRIRRVEVSHAIVSIDLLASKSTAKADMLQDLYEIPSVLFGASTNINQVLVRVLDGSQDKEGTPGPLIATDARREKWLPNEPKLHPMSAEEIQTYLETHYRTTYTPKWQQRDKQKS
ncbi:hypothetical protein [Paenibacillus mucilaginosus]|uniref:Uncharacterized protein n=4 Tax=Paenibacillus mucilaginosus TaxID=61624 RepID=H6NAG4_9BACL|nr:hypothetical protein [Paenibacillus mucilaginosus]AFH62074.1 hypothetical protein B2K_15320 [Paenibacillus mucilaginosus K02]AEI41339.1 hypothetical protein KNP414_02779 [Paenibacillus mucilaginosus KNP414]AFC29889.1 hypothetical protein PM3016_3021 [Paenibacillus mucilaginosus 3016]MCG7211240.1 hypothetical protein [Paenibacillus mucilaginosus]WDM30366.1 hypothetical protein KCX80_14990 [Paenibacillus mucilaginosus]